PRETPARAMGKIPPAAPYAPGVGSDPWSTPESTGSTRSGLTTFRHAAGARSQARHAGGRGAGTSLPVRVTFLPATAGPGKTAVRWAVRARGPRGRPGIRMRAQTARWVAGGTAAASAALIIGGLMLAYVDRHHALPAGQTAWDLSGVFGQVVNL